MKRTTTSSTAAVLLASLLISAPPAAQAQEGWVVSNSTTLAPGCRMEQVAGPSDFLILVDASGSMCPYIQQITSRLGTFVTGLQAKNITDARFAVAVFGGQPQLLQPFVVGVCLCRLSWRACVSFWLSGLIDIFCYFSEQCHIHRANPQLYYM